MTGTEARPSEARPSFGPLGTLGRKMAGLKESTDYFRDYKLLILAAILHGFSFQILLLSPEFIQEESPDENIGNFLVGMNYALFV